MRVQIRVKGYCDPSWQHWLEGLQIAHWEDGTSLFSGALQDQAALYGVLLTIRRLGLTLLSWRQAKNSRVMNLEKRYAREIKLCEKTRADSVLIRRYTIFVSRYRAIQKQKEQ